jgi:hydroxypyruvate reductase/glycerate 2-kinase
MTSTEREMRNHARTIWNSALAAADPTPLVAEAVRGMDDSLRSGDRIIVIGGGKAGSAMAAGAEEALHDRLDRVVGIVNVPEGTQRPLQRIVLHPARPAGSNHPTAAGVDGSKKMLRWLDSAGPDDHAICLISGGGSALMPCPVAGISLEDKQHVTRLLHRCGATIDEMNAVRKHLSSIKGGRLARAFRGKSLTSLIISDVVGDPLDVIASGPTAADPTTFADAFDVLRRHDLTSQIPPAVIGYLEAGIAGQHAETVKHLPDNVNNQLIGNNSRSLRAASETARRLGYNVVNLGPFVEGESRQIAVGVAGIVRGISRENSPLAPPACVLIGGETTVTLGPAPGKGGRNQEFVLAMIAKLGPSGMRGVVALSAGTDGEDGPTDAAGAVAGESTLERAAQQGLLTLAFLDRHDAYRFFDATGDLEKTGLTQTNVNDVRVVLIR